MQTITIPGFIHAHPTKRWSSGLPNDVAGLTYEWNVFPRYREHEGGGMVCPHSMSFVVPDGFDLTPQQVAALKKKKFELTEQFTAAVQTINAQLARLQAITNEASV